MSDLFNDQLVVGVMVMTYRKKRLFSSTGLLKINDIMTMIMGWS